MISDGLSADVFDDEHAIENSDKVTNDILIILFLLFTISPRAKLMNANPPDGSIQKINSRHKFYAECVL